VAIQGSLDEASLPDVVQLLALGRKTGRLSLAEGTLKGEIYLDAGRVCYAFVASRRDRIGDMLVRTGRITQQQLTDAIAAHQSGSQRVSDILLASGQVQRAELLRFMHRQVEEAVYFMFTWRTGSFTFHSGVHPEHQTLLVSIDPEGLLLEGARRVDEWSVIRKKIPSFDLVYRLDRPHLQASEVTLTEEQRHLLPLIDGSRDVTGIMELSGMSEFDVGKAMFGLIAAGFAHLVERRTITRHLDYRELLAYVVREAEFADPEQRRAAARHIADCASCTQRLKTIHVRRSSAMTVPPAATPAPAPVAPAAAEPVRAAEPAGATHASPLPGRSAAPDRRHEERRSGEERRFEDRRHGDRRRVRSPEWERPGVDRRGGGDRRVAERRVAERRLVAAAGMAGGTPSITLVRGSAPVRRTTGPRHVHVPDAGRSPRPASPPARSRPRGRPKVEREAAAEGRAPDPEATLVREIPDLDERSLAAAAASPPAAAAEPPTAAETEAADASAGAELITDGTVRPLPGAVTRHPRPAEHRPRERSRDIQWLVSPDEADTLLRTSRAAAPEAPKPEAPQAEVQAVPAPPAPAEPAVVERPQPEALPAAVPAPARGPRSRHLRAAAAAVVILGAVGVGWLTAPLLQRGPVQQGAVRAASEQPATAAPTVLPEAATLTVPAPAAQEPAAAPPRAAEPAVRTRPPAATRQPDRAAPAVAAPAVGNIRGVVRDAVSGAPLTGARVTIPGTSLAATTDAAGVFVLADVVPGTVSLTVNAADRPAASGSVAVQAGATAIAEFSLEPAPPPAASPAPTPVVPAAPVAAAEADEELAAGGWTASSIAGAADVLGIPLAVIPGLYVESVSVPAGGGRPRVRVAQLTASGQRIVLTETRAGAPVPGTPRVTALRIIPASQTYPLTTGTASFGNLLVTAKAPLPGDSLRALLATLVVAE
jgi:hypothetical protein